MLRVVTGAFQPELEQALVEEVRHIKLADPLAPLLLLVPSHPLKVRLTQLLCHEHRQTLLDVRILSLHQLALDLLAEAEQPLPERFPSDSFFAELVGVVLRHHHASSSEWQAFVHVPGAWDALWQTIRDLKNAGLDAQRLEALVTDDDPVVASRLRESRLSRMFWLAARVLAEKDRLGALDYDDLLAWVADSVPGSRFLQRCHRVLCYGVYDLNQLQLDFFRALVRTCPVTVYFPLIDGHPAFVFAQQFFDRHVQGLRAASSADDDGESVTMKTDGPAKSTACLSGQPCSYLRHLFEERAHARSTHEHQDGSPSIRLLNVPSPADEIDLIAKDILEMVEEKGYAFHEIGVVARSLQGYERLIPRIFTRHRIPFASSLSRPLADYPLARVVQVFLEVKETNFRRDRVLELLSSPFFRLREDEGANACRVFRDHWDVITRRLGITKGLDQWQRLARHGESDLILSRDGDGEEDGTLATRVSAETIMSLWCAIGELHAQLQRFPDRAPWDDFIDILMDVCERHLVIPDERFSIEESGAMIDQGGQAVALAVRRGLEELRSLARVGGEPTFVDFASSVRRLLRKWTVPVSDVPDTGVWVLDAMEARGLSFRVLYVVGINDDRIPRVVQEDAFLRDSHRRWIEMDLGYKLPEKLAAAHEEQLLWYLLLNAARDALVLSYHRTDERDRALAPSPYLVEIERVVGPVAEEFVPRMLEEKAERLRHYRGTRLSPQDLGILWLSTQRENRDELERIHPLWAAIERALSALREHERESASLGVFDGCIGPLDHVERMLSTTGCSPTGLDEYGLCPFRYFANRILKLEVLPDPGAVEEVGAAEWGTMIHDILRETYSELDAGASFTGEASGSTDPAVVLESVARRVFSRFAANAPIGHALFWESRCEQILSFLKKVVQDDVAELAESGWKPIRFEEPIHGMIGEAVGVPLTIRGRMDRVDWHDERCAVRIIDYKCRWSTQPDTHDRNLALGAIRAKKFQPPLYLAGVMAGSLGRLRAEGPEAVRCEGIWFYYLAPKWSSSGPNDSEGSDAFVRIGFPGDAWQSTLREPLRHALTVVVDGIRSGRFFIRPGAHCDHCAYDTICRKAHRHTRWRAQRDPQGSARLHQVSRSTLPVS